MQNLTITPEAREYLAEKNSMELTVSLIQGSYGWAGRVTYPTVSVGRPDLPLEYAELMVDGYLVHLDQRLTALKEELAIDLAAGYTYKKLRLDGYPLCGAVAPV